MKFCTLGLAALGLLWACASIAPMTTTKRYAPASGHALDHILLSEISDEVGPMIFSHKLHKALTASDGKRIRCKECHHEYKGSPGIPPQSCRACHLVEDKARAMKEGKTAL